MASSPALLLIACLILPLLLFLFQKHKTFKNKLPFPPGPRGLPIIGNLHQLKDSPTLHLQLWQLSKKFGPIFSLKLGLRPAIVVSSPKLAKEILKTHDPEFSGRPKLLGQQKLSYNGKDMVFSQYGPYWREIKKLCVAHVLSPKRVSSFSSIRHFEVKEMLKRISMHSITSKAIDLNENMISLTVTIACRIAFGRRFEEEGVEKSRFHGLFNECQAMMASFFVSDYIPFLGWVDRVNGLGARLDRIFEEMDKFYQEIIEEHMDPNTKVSREEDIIDVLLRLKKQRSFYVDLTYDHIKAVSLDMIIGTTNTTAALVVSAIGALVENTRVMTKVQQEIRCLGRNKDFLDEDDVQKFTYMKAVIKETLRLHLPAPLLLPRETNEKCIIDGYEIPAKTLVYVNAWALHRDPEYWKDPEEFHPERFLESAIDFHGQDFELIPFGAGRRICPGLHMGLTTAYLVLANLLYSFDWKLSEERKRDGIDNHSLPGLVHQMKNHLRLVAKTRNKYLIQS